MVIFEFNYHLYRSSVDLALIQSTIQYFADNHGNIYRFNPNIIPVWIYTENSHAMTLILDSLSIYISLSHLNVNALRHANHTGSTRKCRFLSAIVDFSVVYCDEYGDNKMLL